MVSKKPSFIDSPYYVSKPGGGYLKPGAPAEVQREFNEFMQGDEAEALEEVKKLNEEEISRL